MTDMFTDSFEVPACPHCLGVRRGKAPAGDTSIARLLCHTDEGMDCYTLVVYEKHAMPCKSCPKWWERNAS